MEWEGWNEKNPDNTEVEERTFRGQDGPEQDKDIEDEQECE